MSTRREHYHEGFLLNAKSTPKEIALKINAFLMFYCTAIVLPSYLYVVVFFAIFLYVVVVYL